ADQGVGVEGVERVAGDAEAGGGPEVDLLELERFDRGTELLGDLERAVVVGAGQQQEELLAAVAAADVAAAQRGVDRLADAREDVVAGAVAEAVVDLLEVVEIEHHGR